MPLAMTNIPEVRAIVQTNLLARRFLDPLFPRMMFRAEAGEPEDWEGNLGDVKIFTGKGLIEPNMEALDPGQEPQVVSYLKEQWESQLLKYPKKGAIDTDMPTSANAIVKLLLEDAKALGLQAGQSLNRMTRNKLYNAGLSGWTVATATQAANTVIPVARLNGFTRARRPDLIAGSAVRYDLVSTSNPLKVKIAGTARQVVGFTPTIAGDEIGPGTLTLDLAIAVTARDAVIADDCTWMWRVGTGANEAHTNAGRIDSVTSANPLRLSDIRAAIARLDDQSVPAHPEGLYHGHMDAQAQSQLFGDPEMQRVLTSLPEHYMFREAVVGVALRTIWLMNTECPLPDKVVNGNTAVFTKADPFGGELFNTGANTGQKVRHTIIVGQGGLREYYQKNDLYITDAGVTGKIGEFDISNNGIEVRTNGVYLIIRAPLNRHQDQVSSSWKWVGDFVARPDGIVGDAARYKRYVVIQSGE